jgi:dienelactone hydrolase
MLNVKYYTRYVTLHHVTRRERNLEKFSASDTREIGHTSRIVQAAAISCQQQAFIPEYNDTRAAERYSRAATVTKSLCITMGFCNAGRYAFEFSEVPRQAGERL